MINKIIVSHSFEDEVLFEKALFKLESNKLNIIIGPNGSGKTTLSLLFSLLLKSKEIEFYENNLLLNKKQLKKLKNNLAIIFQDSRYQLFNLKVKEELLLNIKKTKEIELEIQKYFTLFNLDLDILSHSSQNLSNGQKRKILLIEALLNSKNKLIILDEPTLDLDEKGKKTLLDALEKIKSRSTIIIFSHDFDTFDLIKNNSFLIKQKKLIKINSIKDIVDNYSFEWLSLKQKIDFFKNFNKEFNND